MRPDSFLRLWHYICAAHSRPLRCALTASRLSCRWTAECRASITPAPSLPVILHVGRGFKKRWWCLSVCPSACLSPFATGCLLHCSAQRVLLDPSRCWRQDVCGPRSIVAIREAAYRLGTLGDILFMMQSDGSIYKLFLEVWFIC